MSLYTPISLYFIILLPFNDAACIAQNASLTALQKSSPPTISLIPVTASSKGSPVAVILTTEMGYGVDFMQGINKYHGSVLSADDLPKALAQLPETLGDF